MTDITWCKVYHELADEPKILRVRDMLGVTAELAQACWLRAILFASKNEEIRGSTAGIDYEDMAWFYSKPVEVIRSIFDCFRTIGLISHDGRLVKWVKRQGAAVAKLAEHAREAVQERIKTPGAIRTERWKKRKKERAASLQAEPGLPMNLPAQGRVTQSVTERVTASPTPSPEASPRQTELESDKDQERIPPRAPPRRGGPIRVYAEPEILMPIRGGRQDGRHRETAHERRRREYNEAMAAAVMARRMAGDGDAASASG